MILEYNDNNNEEKKLTTFQPYLNTIGQPSFFTLILFSTFSFFIHIFSTPSAGQYYTDDQLLNIHAFSLLQHWFYYTRGVSPCGTNDSPDEDIDNYDDLPGSEVSAGSEVEARSDRGQGEVKRSRNASPTPSVAPHPLEESCLQYALRILEQWDRSKWNLEGGEKRFYLLTFF